MKNVTAHLTVIFDIQVYTPHTAGKKPFHARPPMDRHMAKVEFLKPLTKVPWKSVGQVKGILEEWESFPTDVDDDYMDTTPYKAKDLIQTLFDQANLRLDAEKLGYHVAVGNPRPVVKFTPTKDGSREIEYAFEVQLVAGTVQTQWVQTFDGIQAPMLVRISWTQGATAGVVVGGKPSGSAVASKSATIVQPTSSRGKAATAQKKGGKQKSDEKELDAI